MDRVNSMGTAKESRLIFCILGGREARGMAVLVYEELGARCEARRGCRRGEAIAQAVDREISERTRKAVAYNAKMMARIIEDMAVIGFEDANEGG